jgi:hypothetical protein
MATKPKAKKAGAEKPLADRIKAIHEEIEKLITEHVELVGKSAPGVPLGVLRQCAFSRAGGCACREYDHLLKAKS